MLRSIAALAALAGAACVNLAAMRLEASQVGCSRLAHVNMPISGKPEIGCRPHPSRRVHARACTLLRMKSERVRRTPRADECWLHPVSSRSVEAEIQAAGGRGRRALPCVRAGGDVSLCARAQIHA